MVLKDKKQSASDAHEDFRSAVAIRILIIISLIALYYLRGIFLMLFWN